MLKAKTWENQRFQPVFITKNRLVTAVSNSTSPFLHIFLSSTKSRLRVPFFRSHPSRFALGKGAFARQGRRATAYLDAKASAFARTASRTEGSRKAGDAPSPFFGES
jgi:hypothetical protein